MRIFSAFSALLLSASAMSAQVLNDFSAFQTTGDTYINGNWAAATLTQGAGVFNVVGGTNDAFSGAENWFMTGASYTSLNLGANHSLALTAMILPGTTASSISVTIFDSSKSASAVFDLSGFSTGSYQTSVAAVTDVYGINWAAIEGFKISGAITSGTAPLNMSFDNLSAVPEPATYAAILGLATLGFVGYRRYRRS